MQKKNLKNVLIKYDYPCVCTVVCVCVRTRVYSYVFNTSNTYVTYIIV